MVAGPFDEGRDVVGQHQRSGCFLYQLQVMIARPIALLD